MLTGTLLAVPPCDHRRADLWSIPSTCMPMAQYSQSPTVLASFSRSRRISERAQVDACSKAGHTDEGTLKCILLSAAARATSSSSCRMRLLHCSVMPTHEHAAACSLQQLATRCQWCPDPVAIISAAASQCSRLEHSSLESVCEGGKGGGLAVGIGWQQAQG